MDLKRPMPPPDLELRYPEAFDPSPELLRWIRETFLTEGGPLYNRDHEHLQQASIGVLWTNVAHRHQMRAVAATAEMPRVQGNPWVKARMTFQLEQWFGEEPTFLLTFDSVYAALANDATWCARVEHELYHCGQVTDEYGSPKFRRDGTPVFGIRTHDVEQFIGVVRRYGMEAAHVEELVAAAQRAPLMQADRIDLACGTCAGVI